MKITITRPVLKSCLQGARESHPSEFVGLLSGKSEADEVLADGLYLAPLASADRNSTSFNPYHLPAGLSLVGSFHSHPSGPAAPSNADLQMFSKSGRAHLIASYPYDEASVRAFDREGRPIEIEMI